MLFVTDTFLIFFLIVYIAFWIAPASGRINVLLIASLVFYGSWSLAFTAHFIGVVGINYIVMEIWRRRRNDWLFFCLQAANVCNIAFFKYFYFIADVIGATLGLDELREPALQYAHAEEGRRIFLPLAISFYTFQIMSYGFDIRRGAYTRKHRFRDVLLFKAFFPQLIAGPIMRAGQLLPQIADYDGKGRTAPDFNRMKKGLWFILIGIVKKLLIADRLLVFLAPMVNAQATPLDFAALDVWFAVIGCMFMLYADFSAYTDLARGFGFLLGFDIPVNFQAPFFLKSFGDLWRRWHITFSLWIRDYIFIPLGGSRVPEARIYFNFICTFFLGGLWNGAAYTFVIWGVLMGVYLSLEAFLARRGFVEWPDNWNLRILRLSCTWVLLVCCMTFFFAPSVEWSLEALSVMFGISGGGSLTFQPLRRYENWLLPLLGLAVMLVISQFAGGQKDFFYFQF